MPVIKKVNFSGGEIDPALYDRDNFEKHKAGLKTALNVMIGKTGRIISRPGTLYEVVPKYPTRRHLVRAPKRSETYIEWGHEYVRVINYYTGASIEASHSYTEDDLDDLDFEFSGKFCYIFKDGSQPLKLNISTGVFVSSADVFKTPANDITGITIGASGTASYSYQYAITQIINGEETTPEETAGVTAPASASEFISLSVTGVAATFEFNVYRRPMSGGNVYGYVGSIAVGSLTFRDFDIEPDYSRTIPDETSYFKLSSDALIDCDPKTGIVYQQRLLLGNLNQSEEAIVATRTGQQSNFNRDFPLTDDSALTFKCGTGGNAKVLRFLDAGPLIAFTTNGVYANPGGPLTPDTAYMEYKAGYVIDDSVRPLSIPGALLFVDKATNTVRRLLYSQEGNNFEAPEVSIFSDHMFRNKSVRAWTFQEGQLPALHVVFDDGTASYFVYQKEHEMTAWTRANTMGEYIDCCTVYDSETARDQVLYVIKRNDTYVTVVTADRFVSDKKELVQVDQAVKFSQSVHGAAGIPSTSFSFTPVGPDGWSGEVRIDSTVSAFSSYVVGDVFRMFGKDKEYYDLEVTQLVSGTQIIVTPDREIPLELREDFILYETVTSLSGLDHLNGEDVSIYIDGQTYTSPLNDRDNLPKVTVTSGSVSFPRSAFVVVGLPFAVDVETLDVSAEDDDNTTGKLVTGVTVRTLNSKGFFVAQTFDNDNGVAGMEEPELSSSERVNFGPLPEQVDTYNVRIPNSWDSKGRVCIRNVDPTGLEILSIKPDVIS